MQAHDEAALRTLLPSPLRVALERHRCARFNAGLSRDASLAVCLAGGDDGLSPRARPHVIATGSGFVVEVAGTCTTYSVALSPKRDGSLRVASLASENTCRGIAGGMIDTSLTGAPPPPPPPPPPPRSPHNVPPTLLEGYRIAGNQAIAPDDLTKVAIARAGRERLIGSLKLCVDETGAVTIITLLKSTGFPDYDAKLEREMWQWRYKPYEVNGRPVRVCTAITFIYKQTLPPPPPRGSP